MTPMNIGRFIHYSLLKFKQSLLHSSINLCVTNSALSSHQYNKTFIDIRSITNMSNAYTHKYFKIYTSNKELCMLTTLVIASELFKNLSLHCTQRYSLSNPAQARTNSPLRQSLSAFTDLCLCQCTHAFWIIFWREDCEEICIALRALQFDHGFF